jgi:hypothetical protein
MIYYLVTSRYSSTIRQLLRGVPELKTFLRCLTYEELFFQLSAPVGHYIFSDIDRLTRHDRETAARFADRLRQVSPKAKIFNDPVAVLDRVPLLSLLQRTGINDYGVTRLDTGAYPSRFPVFIRTEDGHFGVETELLHDRPAFDRALDSLRSKRLPLHGRIAVEFAAAPHPDGKFRRYSAYRIGDRVFNDELFVSPDWAVKSDVSVWDPELVAEELACVRSNPHVDTLQRAFELGRIEFGRMDYGVIDGKVQVYEINTNPVFAIGPRAKGRRERRWLVEQMTVEAFRALDTPLDQRGRVTFSTARPRAHALRWPNGWLLPRSLFRRMQTKLRSALTR